jgi:hypothetical protein
MYLQFCRLPGVRQEYAETLINILNGSTLEKSHLDLCNDRIREIYQICETICNGSNQGLERLTNVVQIISTSKTIIWFQLIHKMLLIWNTNQLRSRYLEQFADSYSQMISKTEELEASIETALELVINAQKEFALMQTMMDTIPQYKAFEALLGGKTFKKLRVSDVAKNSYLSLV